MFEVQWLENATKDWLFRASYDSDFVAELRAQTAAALNGSIHRVVQQPSDRVVAVFSSNGKRLTFPIAIAIAYAALAKIENKDGYNRGYMARGLRFYGRSEPDDWKEGMTDEICGVLRDRALAGRDDTAQKKFRGKFREETKP